MINQNIMFRFTLTLARNHPDMYEDFMHMGQVEVAEFIRETYGVVLNQGTSWDNVGIITNVMDKQHQARING